MSDQIGRIFVPEILVSGTFPIVPDYPYGRAISPEVTIHQFGSGDAKIEQRFLLGNGARRFTVRKAWLSDSDRRALRDFWEQKYGPYGAFTFNAPHDDGLGTSAYTCRFANEPLSWEMVTNAICSLGVTLVEIPTTEPSYGLNAVETRFPGSALTAALLSQVQEVIPLVRLQPLESGYPAIYLSDRRCTIGGQLYQARLLEFDGISQSVGNEADEANFTFGNADRVMRDLANDVDLFRAEIGFSLFHVATGIKLDLWKGDIVNWGMDSGPEFHVTAADGLYELNLPYPPRRISRTCWKQFNDGQGCPFTSQGAMDYGHFPSADPTTCDKGYETPNGCLAHGMKRYYGGILAEPQGVRIKDNSTGIWGFGRSTITSVSLVAESIYDQVVPEIYTDSDMPVNCKIAAGRDESDFYIALGIVGEGPLGAYGVGHKLDEQYHHGYPGSFGLRQVLGSDPAGAQDWLSLDQSGNTTGGDWRRVFSGNSTYKDNFAAGTAFLVIRRSDTKGLQLSRPGDHTMQAIVAQGLRGWVWTAPGARSWQVLTNPVWIVINMLLRARGLRFADASASEQYFDVDAAVAAASISDQQVAKLFGSGTETQFKFRGVLQEEKPLRDWAQEVLMNCLGYYTFAFGKLKLGVRVNSSVVEAFTLGNILFQSLQLSPLKPSFNYLAANFADEEFEFANNSITLYDIDHAKLIGGAASPLFLKANINLAGTANKSQAARIITTRLREELGGTSLAEWKAARQVAFRTTVLALNVEPGMVCSMTHPDMPAGHGEFRVVTWRLNKDFSIEIQGRTTTDSMYNLVAGPKPADVPASPFPRSFRDLLPRPPFGWMPYHVAPLANDPIFDPTEWGFGLKPKYETAADGTAMASLIVSGKLPVNVFSSIRAPILSKTVTSQPTNGSIKGGRTYYLLVCAKDASGGFSESSEIVKVDIPTGTDTNTITVTVEAWPDGAPGGYSVFAGENRDRLSWQQDGADAPSQITIAGPLNVAAWGVPDGEFDRLRLRAKKIFHSGVFGAQVGGVTANTIQVAGGNFTVNQWAGYVVSIVALYNSTDPLPILNYRVASNDADTLTLETGHDPLADGVKLGDVLIMRHRPTIVSANTIGDPNTHNCFYPDGATDDESGRLIRIIAGRGRGQVRKVVSNTTTTWTIEGEWDEFPDTSSIFIVEEAKWEVRTESTPLDTVDPLQNMDFAVRVDNLVRETVLVQAVGVDGGAHESIDADSPVREIYLFGGPGTVTKDFQARFVDGADPLESGSDLMDNHYRVAEDNLLEVNLEEWTAQLKEAPASAVLTVDILRSTDNGTSWASLFPGDQKPSVAVGETRSSGTAFAIPTLNRDDILRYDLTADGVAAGLEFVLRGKKVLKAA
jgi:hypothetical protein